MLINHDLPLLKGIFYFIFLIDVEEIGHKIECSALSIYVFPWRYSFDHLIFLNWLTFNVLVFKGKRDGNFVHYILWLIDMVLL